MGTRRDNNEYHNGAKAYRDGVSILDNPHLMIRNDIDSRYRRWSLGWREAEGAAPRVFGE